MRNLHFLICLIILTTGTILGGRVDGAWSNLGTLTAGQKIQVVDENLKSFIGSFVKVSETAIQLRVDEDLITVEREKVYRVSLREKSKRGRNALIGLGIGVGTGLAVGLALDSRGAEEGEYQHTMILVPACCGVGAGIGALFSGYQTLYRAPRE